MTRDHFLSLTKFRKNLLLIMIVFLPAPVLLAQLPAKVEKALDDYYSEIAKVLQVIESEEVETDARYDQGPSENESQGGQSAHELS